MLPPRNRALAISSAIALMAAPGIAVMLKMLYGMWLTLFLLFASPVLLVLYGVATLFAVTGFLPPLQAFAVGGRRTVVRASIAAWTSSIGIVMVGLFIEDFGDSPEMSGSTFDFLVGAAGPDASPGHALAGVSGSLFLVGMLLFIGAGLWFVVEWIVAFGTRKRRLASQAAAWQPQNAWQQQNGWQQPQAVHQSGFQPQGFPQPPAQQQQGQPPHGQPPQGQPPHGWMPPAAPPTERRQ